MESAATASTLISSSLPSPASAQAPQDEDELSYVIRHLRASRGQWPKVAAGSGVPYATVVKVAQDRTPNPRYGTVRRLAQWFRNHAGNP